MRKIYNQNIGYNQVNVRRDRNEHLRRTFSLTWKISCRWSKFGVITYKKRNINYCMNVNIWLTKYGTCQIHNYLFMPKNNATYLSWLNRSSNIAEQGTAELDFYPGTSITKVSAYQFLLMILSEETVNAFWSNTWRPVNYGNLRKVV